MTKIVDSIEAADSRQNGFFGLRMGQERIHSAYLSQAELDELESFKPGPSNWREMDEFAEEGDIYGQGANFRPAEAMTEGISAREMAIRKGLSLIEAATCSKDLYVIIDLWADHSISIQVQDMDNKILALEETWAQRDAKLAREAARETRQAKANRQAQYEALYSDLFARAAEYNATTLAIVIGQGDVIMAVGGVSKDWRPSDVKAMLAATETRLNGGRLEFVI